MRTQCTKCHRGFKTRVGALLCDDCKIEIYNNAKQKSKESQGESQGEKEMTPDKDTLEETEKKEESVDEEE